MEVHSRVFASLCRSLQEAAVKSTKTHFKRSIGESRLTIEELATIHAQVESCLNSRHLTSLNLPDDDGLQVLTTVNFLIGKPLQASQTCLICLVHPLLFVDGISAKHSKEFWKQWCSNYATSLNKFTKWR